MQFLRQATATQSVLIGPFVASTDGVTAETELTIANTDILLSANGGTMTAKNSGGGTHDADGWYAITLDATDTATVGRLQLSVAATGALPVFAEFQVVEESVYDALFATPGATFGAYVGGTGAAALQTTASATSSSLTGLINEIGTNGDNLLSVPWNAAWDAEVQSEVADALTAYGVSTAAALATAQADLDIITGADGVNLLSETQASIDAIVQDTGTIIPALFPSDFSTIVIAGGLLPVNVEKVNDTTLYGDGTTGNLFRVTP